MDFQNLLNLDPQLVKKAAHEAIEHSINLDGHILPRGTPLQAAISRLPDGFAVHMEERMADMQKDLREWYIGVLGTIGGEDESQVLRRLLVQAIGDENTGPDMETVRNIMENLAGIGGLSAFHTLIALQASEHPEIAQNARRHAEQLFIGGREDYTEPSIREIQRSTIFTHSWA